MSKAYKILDTGKDCVLLENISKGLYQVRDIENDIICMSPSYETAYNCFLKYDINEVRKEKQKLFKEWLKEYTQA